ncbi:helix-turn-helix transcriptional regulator [Catenisphaera adipataccumulans]|jgi:AraC-like DNA-binding protein|uniref:AraC-like DNA-binding protein n=1 Tax=Catenisphaera adipataccumulans TaxID=700500 RepID=A0A7W8FX28_9FIRM|nr:AraC family transcriptional regulator [Catenisphaera adipataccumulans]MBB5182542.1 AraC-like DNA-binding protein [Catenisphaera adipataccumulans]
MHIPDLNARTEEALEELGKAFPNLNWNFRPDPVHQNVLVSQWLGDPDDDVMLCAFKGNYIHEAFHRQEFFFFNFAWQGDYEALSAKYDHKITIKQGDCYIGQPFSGYALRCDQSEDVIILGILIQKGAFLEKYLPVLAADQGMYRFFLDPQTNRFSDEYVHLTFAEDSLLWPLLQTLILTYHDHKEDLQIMVQPLILAVMMFISYQYHIEYGSAKQASLAEQIVYYIETHSQHISLKELSEHFGYHPNYISSILPEQTGRTFSETVLKVRMEKAELLLKNTDMTIEKIAAIIGYSNTSNFYKAFRSYFHQTPRSYQTKNNV